MVRVEAVDGNLPKAYLGLLRSCDRVLGSQKLSQFCACVAASPFER